MRRLGGLALVIAASLALAACGGNLFGSSSSSSSSSPSSSAPKQSSYQYNGARDTGSMGPGTHDQNRD